MLDIAEELHRWVEQGRDFAVATVVTVGGSAPRRPGAALAVDAGGTAIGSVSGGCVEGAVYELCRQALQDGETVLERFGYSDEDAFAVGLTCGGVIDILVTPVRADDPARPATAAALAAAARGEAAALARVVSGPAELMGRALVVHPDGPRPGDPYDGPRPGAPNTGDSRSGDFRAGDSRSGDFRAGDSRSGDFRAGDSRSGDFRAGDLRSGDFRAGDLRSGDFRAGDSRSGDFRAGDSRSGDFRAGDSRPGDFRAGDSRSGDFRAGDSRTGNPRTGNPRAGDSRSGAPRAGDLRSGAPRTGDLRSGAPRTGGHYTGGHYTGGFGAHPELDRTVAAEAGAFLDAGRTGTLEIGERGSRCGAPLTVLVESSVPAPRMIVFGAIDFASALVRAGRFLGYHVTVCDARPVFATGARFPDADEIVVEWPHEYLRRTEVDARTVLCVLTHDAKFDVPLLRLALRLPVAYVGAMGSRRTHLDRNARLREVGVSDLELARLRSPIGLDLGARTPEETALSIAAEIVATRRGGTGASLTGAHTPIHHDGPATPARRIGSVA